MKPSAAQEPTTVCNSGRHRPSLHGHASRHGKFCFVNSGNRDRVALYASLNLYMFACKWRDGLRLRGESINFVARHERVARLALQTLGDALGVGFARQHVLLAAHCVADDSFDGLGRSMNLLECGYHGGEQKSKGDDRHLSHAFSPLMLK